MHEALFDDSFLEGTGVTTLDFAKTMIDEGYHPMTMYFPLVVHGAMLIEPTESESKESLDRFIHVLREMAQEAKAGKRERSPQTRAALEAEGRGQARGGVIWDRGRPRPPSRSLYSQCGQDACGPIKRKPPLGTHRAGAS